MITNSYSLTQEEIIQFYKKGFAGPFTLYSQEEIKEIWRNSRIKLPDRRSAIYPFDTLSGNTNLANYDRHFDIPELRQHICNKKIVDRVNSIFGNDIFCWRSEFFVKYPGDEGTDWHQADIFAHASGRPQLLWTKQYGPFSGGTLTCWTAFTEATEENGCLQLIPGTHKKMFYDELLTHQYDPNLINANDKNGIKRGFFGYDYRNLQIDPNWIPDDSQAYNVVLKAGQCILFLSTLMHASLPNTSTDRKNVRVGYVSRYIPTCVKVYPDTDTLEEYGSSVPLDNYKPILVSGQDNYNLNRHIMTKNELI